MCVTNIDDTTTLICSEIETLHLFVGSVPLGGLKGLFWVILSLHGPHNGQQKPLTSTSGFWKTTSSLLLKSGSSFLRSVESQNNPEKAYGVSE